MDHRQQRREDTSATPQDDRGNEPETSNHTISHASNFMTSSDTRNKSVWLPSLPFRPTCNEKIVDSGSTHSEADVPQTPVHISPKNFEASYPRWHDAFAGAMAGAGSRLVTAPLDLLRIRRQLMQEVKVSIPSPVTTQQPFTFLYYPQLLKQIVQTEKGGVLALFRGNLAAMNMWVAYAAVQFSVYAPTSDYLRHWQVPQFLSSRQQQSREVFLHPSLVAFIAGAAAGVCATISTYPLDICRTTFAARGPLQSQPTVTTNLTKSSLQSSSTAPPTSLWGFATQMYQTRGLKGFYAGCGPAIVQIIPYMGFNFCIYEYVVHKLQEQQEQCRTEQRVKHPPVEHSGLAGAIAGCISKLIIYPLDTIKKRLQIQSFFERPWDESMLSSSRTGQPSNSHQYYTSMYDCAWKMYHVEGAASFYRGMLPSLLKNSIAASLTFTIYSTTKQFLET